jgi:hypothetical protein
MSIAVMPLPGLPAPSRNPDDSDEGGNYHCTVSPQHGFEDGRCQWR